MSAKKGKSAKRKDADETGAAADPPFPKRQKGISDTSSFTRITNVTLDLCDMQKATEYLSAFMQGGTEWEIIRLPPSRPLITALAASMYDYSTGETVEDAHGRIRFNMLQQISQSLFCLDLEDALERVLSHHSKLELKKSKTDVATAFSRAFNDDETAAKRIIFTGGDDVSDITPEFLSFLACAAQKNLGQKLNLSYAHWNGSTGVSKVNISPNTGPECILFHGNDVWCLLRPKDPHRPFELPEDSFEPIEESKLAIEKARELYSNAPFAQKSENKAGRIAALLKSEQQLWKSWNTTLPITVALCAPSGYGKSSLINYLISGSIGWGTEGSSPSYLPTGGLQERLGSGGITVLPTFVKYGSEFSVQEVHVVPVVYERRCEILNSKKHPDAAHLPDQNVLKRLGEVPAHLAPLKGEVLTGDAAKARLHKKCTLNDILCLSYLLVTLPSEFLKLNNLRLLDLPGYDDAEDAEIKEDFTKYASELLAPDVVFLGYRDTANYQHKAQDIVNLWKKVIAPSRGRSEKPLPQIVCFVSGAREPENFKEPNSKSKLAFTKYLKHAISIAFNIIPASADDVISILSEDKGEPERMDKEIEDLPERSAIVDTLVSSASVWIWVPPERLSDRAKFREHWRGCHYDQLVSLTDILSKVRASRFKNSLLTAKRYAVNLIQPILSWLKLSHNKSDTSPMAFDFLRQRLQQPTFIKARTKVVELTKLKIKKLNFSEKLIKGKEMFPSQVSSLFYDSLLEQLEKLINHVKKALTKLREDFANKASKLKTKPPDFPQVISKLQSPKDEEGGATGIPQADYDPISASVESVIRPAVEYLTVNKKNIATWIEMVPSGSSRKSKLEAYSKAIHRFMELMKPSDKARNADVMDADEDDRDDDDEELDDAGTRMPYKDIVNRLKEGFAKLVAIVQSFDPLEVHGLTSKTSVDKNVKEIIQAAKMRAYQVRRSLIATARQPPRKEKVSTTDQFPKISLFKSDNPNALKLPQTTFKTEVLAATALVKAGSLAKADSWKKAERDLSEKIPDYYNNPDSRLLAFRERSTIALHVDHEVGSEQAGFHVIDISIDRSAEKHVKLSYNRDSVVPLLTQAVEAASRSKSSGAYPIFILARKRVNKDGIVYHPNIWVDKMGNVSAIAIVFVQHNELAFFANLFRQKGFKSTQVIFLARSELNVSQGVCRSLMLMVAEHFRFPYIWMIDDDIKRIKEYEEDIAWPYSSDAKVPRAFLFGQQVMQAEAFPTDVAAVAARQSVLDNLIDDDDFSDCIGGLKLRKVIGPLMRNTDTAKNPQLLFDAVNSVVTDANLTEVQKARAWLEPLKNGSQIGVIGLWNSLSSTQTSYYDRLRAVTPTTHSISSVAYQFILVNMDAVKGIRHVSDSALFLPPLARADRKGLATALAQTKNQRKGSFQHLKLASEEGLEALKRGYKWEDAAWNRQLMLHGIGCMQMYWFSMEHDMEAPSVVEGENESELNSVASEESFDVPDQSDDEGASSEDDNMQQ